MEIADIAKQPSLWPKQIVILVPVRFPVVLNGVNIGNIQVPPHSAVVLQKVNPDGTVMIERQGSQAKVKAQETDLSARVALAQEKSTPSLPDAVPVPATASLPAASVPAP